MHFSYARRKNTQAHSLTKQSFKKWFKSGLAAPSEATDHNGCRFQKDGQIIIAGRQVMA